MLNAVTRSNVTVLTENDEGVVDEVVGVAVVVDTIGLDPITVAEKELGDVKEVDGETGVSDISASEGSRITVDAVSSLGITVDRIGITVTMSGELAANAVPATNTNKSMINFFEMNFENDFPAPKAGKTKIKNFIKPPLPQEFRGKGLDIVAGGDDKNEMAFFLQPVQKSSQDSLGQPPIGFTLALPHGLFRFVHPQDGGRHGLGDLEYLV